MFTWTSETPHTGTPQVRRVLDDQSVSEGQQSSRPRLNVPGLNLVPIVPNQSSTPFLMVTQQQLENHLSRVLEAVRLSADHSRREETMMAEASINDLARTGRDLHDAVVSSFGENQELREQHQLLVQQSEVQNRDLRTSRLQVTE